MEPEGLRAEIWNGDPMFIADVLADLGLGVGRQLAVHNKEITTTW